MDKLIAYLEKFFEKYGVEEDDKTELSNEIGTALGELMGQDLEELKSQYGENEEVEEEDGDEGNEEVQEEDGEFEY